MPLNAALAGFVCDSLAYAEGRSTALAERLLRSPFCGVDRDEACALIVAAAGREPLEDTIAARSVPLSRKGTAAASRFVAGLGAIAAAFRAPGIGAREMLATIAGTLALEPDDDVHRATLQALRRVADEFDATRVAASLEWKASDFIELIDAALSVEGTATAAGSRPATLGPWEPERPSPVGRRQGHFSASSLGTYAECERKWYYRYVCAAVEDRGSSASFYGSAFHYALEQFHREFPRADLAPARALPSKLDAYVVDAFERFRKGFGTNVEFELQKRRARRTAKRYLAWFLDRSRAHPFEVIGQETEVGVNWEGHTFVGFIDRLDRDDATGNVTVIDYKTGAIAESAAEYRERIARLLDFQLPFYYWARSEAGDHVTRLALVPLKDALLEVLPIELEVVPVAAGTAPRNAATGLIGIDELRRAKLRMVQIAAHLSGDSIERFGATNDPEACTFCTYRNACRERPRRREDRFGR